MEALYFLEKLRMPGLNELMLMVTRLGEETAFLVIALIVFWCVDKNKGYYILSVGFVGTLANQFMKLWFRIPRPWVLDQNFTIVEAAREAATGYSFPSGHTQSAVGTFGAIAYTTGSKWIRTICIAAAVLVPFSRMYLGVHTPLDVSVAAAIAVMLIIALKPAALNRNCKYLSYTLAGMTLLELVYLLFVELYPFPQDIDPHNLESGISSAYTFFGCLTGLITAYIVDKRWQNFSTKAVWWAQILKVAGGLVLVLLIKVVLKTPLNALMGEHLGRACRYFFVVIVAGILWPYTFKWFARLGKKENNS